MEFFFYSFGLISPDVTKEEKKNLTPLEKEEVEEEEEKKRKRW